MLGVAVLLGLAASEHVIESPLTRTLYFLLAGGFAGITLGLIIVLLVLPPARVAKISSWIGNRTMLHRLLLRVFQVIGQFRNNPAAVLLSIVLSVLITLSIVTAVILLARGFKGGGLTALDFANATVFALVANIVPITPGGVGVAEGCSRFSATLGKARHDVGLWHDFPGPAVDHHGHQPGRQRRVCDL